ncbi:TPA: XRE family transcriptional regulator, partial [Klebsiella pneumoniae]
MTMADEKTARYVAYIDSLITVSPKSQSAISREIGYKNPNILSLIKKGRIPLPVEKVLPLAEALNADPVRLMMMVLEDRQP